MFSSAAITCLQYSCFTHKHEQHAYGLRSAWPWLQYIENQDAVVCFTCAKAISDADMAFITTVMVLHMHKSCADQVCITIGNEFIQVEATDKPLLGSFPPTDLD